MSRAPRPSTALARFAVGGTALLLLAVNTLFWCALLFAVALAKFLVPVPAWRRICSRALVCIAEAWVAVNSWGLSVTQPTRWDVDLPATLSPDVSYLVVSNHQSWVDIPVLQKVLLGRIPFLRFFLKSQLIWVPLLGAAWWALDFPFMKRHSREYLERHPERRGEDLATTRSACARFRGVPVSILNFAEGTRFTEAKRERFHSPYRHLLPPRAGGVAFTAAAMGDTLRSVVDVTIAYPDGRPTFWDLLSRGVPRVVVRAREIPIPAEWFTGDYQEDAAFRERVQALIRGIWEEKDALLSDILGEAGAG
jgi:1-acyl-sn-glycerol-3-phosphate acyltransferase